MTSLEFIETLPDLHAFSAGPSPNPMTTFETRIETARRQLLHHPLFENIQSFEDLRFFMERHVFAVWDFMSLLKTLQLQLTCTTVPWQPPSNREAARFINEIVVGEESDQIGHSTYISHFELYLEAMREGGANSWMIDSFLKCLMSGQTFEQGLSAACVASSVREFVRSTMGFCRLPAHRVAAAFLYGREDIIPDMFSRLLRLATPTQATQFQKLKIYLERHIEVDGGSHGPMAKKLMLSLCGNDIDKWTEASRTAISAIAARRLFWDSILAALPHHPR